MFVTIIDNFDEPVRWLVKLVPAEVKNAKSSLEFDRIVQAHAVHRGNKTLDDKLASGVPIQDLVDAISKEITEEQGCLQLPWVLVLFVSYFVVITSHFQPVVQYGIHRAILVTTLHTHDSQCLFNEMPF